MKDLEKIKSEDLGCQVQDANPANFAIEQEVAAMVGATVPAPTAPSADDARELGAQLLVFLRRALTPIQTALRTALAAIYAHLDSRCTDYTPAAYAPYQPRPYDPMGTPQTPRSVANLLQAITAFASRKISNGSAPSDGIPDGTSLAHLLCSTAAANAVTELVDDNRGWTIDTVLNTTSMFPSCEKVTLGCEKADFVNFGYNGGSLLNADCEYYLPNLKKIVPKPTGVGWPQTLIRGTQTHDVDCPELEEITAGDWFGFCGSSAGVATTPFTINLPKLRICPTLLFRPYDAECTCGVSKIVLGKIETNNFNPIGYFRGYYALPNLIHLEFGAGTAVSLNLSGWNPTNALSSSASDLVADPTAHPTWKNLDQFLQNFKDHIALRLTSNGSGLTLTLSQAVRNAIHAAEATYGIEAIIVTQKGWTLSPAPTA